MNKAQKLPVCPASNYTANQRRRLVEAFEFAKKHLQKLDGSDTGSHWTSYICNTLYTGGLMHETARHIITKRLSPYISVTEYLRDTATVWPMPRDIQAFRHRWLDELIQEFSQ